MFNERDNSVKAVDRALDEIRDSTFGGAEKEYVYQDAEGRISYIIYRYPEKQFRVKRREGNELKWGIGDTQSIPYNLPQVIDEKEIWIVEGEKDADTLIDLGLCATTFPFGAGSFGRTDYSYWFKGKDLIICPDNDLPGKKYADVIKDKLQSVASSIKVIALPELAPGGDVSEWIGDGQGDVFELAQIASKCKVSKPPRISTRLTDVEPKKVEFLWDPYIPMGKLTLMDGDPGVGKSWLTHAIASAVSRGSLLPSGRLVKGRVLLLSCEDGIEDTIVPRLRALDADLNMIDAYTDQLDLTLEGMKTLNNMIIESKPVIVFLDPLVSYLGPELDLNRANETRNVLTRLGAMAQEHGTAMVLIRHLRKEMKPGKAIYRGTGSIDIVGAARSALMVVEDEDELNRKVMYHTKSNVAQKGEKVEYSLAGGEFYWIGGTVRAGCEELGVSKEQIWPDVFPYMGNVKGISQ